MRENLFKAKLIDDGAWVEGVPVDITPLSCFDSPKKEVLIVRAGFADWGMPRQIEGGRVDPETVCQYIGRTDSRKNKIFENDILSVKSEAGECYRFVVRFGVCGGTKNVDHEAGYMGFYLCTGNETQNPCISLRKDILYWLNAYQCEVVGNIFDDVGGNV